MDAHQSGAKTQLQESISVFSITTMILALCHAPGDPNLTGLNPARSSPMSAGADR